MSDNLITTQEDVRRPWRGSGQPSHAGLLRRGLLLAALVLLGCLGVLMFQAAPPRAFHPDRVAELEAEGWRAYYDRDWMRVFRLMVQLNREQFGMSLPTAFAAALDIVRATIAFAPPDGANDVAAATQHLEHFYAKAQQARGLPADAQTLAAREMDYWIVHRQLAIARKQDPDHAGDLEPMIAALARLHAGLFDAPPDAIRRSAEYRAAAAAAVDRITGGYSPDIAADWQQIKADLTAAYRSLQ